MTHRSTYPSRKPITGTYRTLRFMFSTLDTPRTIGRFELVKGARFYGQKSRTTGNSPLGGGEPSVCGYLSQVCSGPGFGGPLHANVASGPWVGISAGVSARVRGVRDGGGGSAPNPEDSQIGSTTDRSVDDSRNSQSHFRVGIWLVLCRRSHGDAARCHLSVADAQAISWVRTRKYEDDGCSTS